MPAQYDRIPNVVKTRHNPPKASPTLHLRMGEAICKCCGQRKTRKGGKTIGGRFYCIDCKGEA